MITRYIRKFREIISNIEPVVLIGFMLLWWFLWSFLEISEEVLEGDTHAIDTKILMLLRDGNNPKNPLGPIWFSEMVRDLTSLGGIAILVLVTLSAALYLFMTKKSGQALYLLLSVGLGTAIANVLKLGYARPRPDLVPHGAYTFTDSFPSGHSMMSAMVYLSIGMLLARAHEHRAIKIYFLSLSVFLTILIGVSRVYLGVHWPSDVLAGWMAGGAVAIMFWLVEWAWQEKINNKIKVLFSNY